MCVLLNLSKGWEVGLNVSKVTDNWALVQNDYSVHHLYIALCLPAPSRGLRPLHSISHAENSQ